MLSAKLNLCCTSPKTELSTAGETKIVTLWLSSAD